MRPQLQKLALLDAVINNADRKGGHCLLDESERLWGIDHGLTFHRQYKLRTVIWDFAGQKIDKALLDDLRNLCEKLDTDDDPYSTEISSLISEREKTALRQRIDVLLSQKTYPHPGPGPNRPWPPI
jgi:uncharacterized repeat protein (TIGR03843 family)